MQDTFRVTRSLTLNARLRYDLQTFEPGKLMSNPLYRAVGKGSDRPRTISRPGSALPTRSARRTPLVIRGGGGMFYMPIPCDVRLAGGHRQRNHSRANSFSTS